MKHWSILILTMFIGGCCNCGKQKSKSEKEQIKIQTEINSPDTIDFEPILPDPDILKKSR